jgi:phosphotransferase family enzyme
MTTAQPAPRMLDADQLTPLVRELVGKDVVLTEWAQEPLGWLNIMNAELWRVSGTARTDRGATSIPWSLVLKSFRPPKPESASALPESWDYWKRELAIYRSPTLRQLRGGLVAPRYLGVIEKPDGTLLLGMEQIEAASEPWDFERYGRAARVAGRFNAGHLQPGAPEDGPAFTVGGLRSWVENLVILEKEKPDLWDAPLVRRAIPDPADARRLFEECPVLLDALDRIPQTFVHRDLWPANLLFRNVDGIEQFVAIDWMLAGAGALGEDAAGMMGPTLWHLLVEPTDADAFESAVLAGYLEGLRDEGWDGPDELARFGCAATLALRFGLLIPPWLAFWLQTDRDWAERKFGRSVESTADGWGVLLRWLLGQAEQARALAGSLGLA